MAIAVETRLGSVVRAAAGGPADQSGICALTIAQEAFAARVLLARAAERSLDVQCYIWRADTTGLLLLEELWHAAGRGVRVRLLLDDNGIAGLDPILAALNTHANLDVRLFNPFRQRRYKALGYLTDFRRLNRRMHNKSFTADSEATIVGGRNVGDEYFGAGQRMVFADLDVLAVGPIAREVEAAFDLYWNDRSAERVETVIGPVRPEDVSQMRARFAATRGTADAVALVEAVGATRLIETLLAGELPLDWVPALLLCDPPAKIAGKAPDTELIFAQLQEALGAPRRSIEIVSPYFVPGRKGTNALARFPKRGVALSILTNSLAATDVSVVHAGYTKYRKPLLRSGAKLYELKPESTGLAATRRRAHGGVGSSSVSLHAKTFSVDGTRVFIGSLNLDPRSARLNTEMGVVIDSPRLADAIARDFDRAIREDAYEVVLSTEGTVEWVEATAHGDVRHHHEPRTRLGKRALIKLLSWLPIEELL